jgi:hypothetical protein
MTKQLYHVATDGPFGDGHPDHHDRDFVYLVWLSEDDLAEMLKRADGRVSYWEAGVCETLDHFIAAWGEHQDC